MANSAARSLEMVDMTVAPPAVRRGEHMGRRERERGTKREGEMHGRSQWHRAALRGHDPPGWPCDQFSGVLLPAGPRRKLLTTRFAPGT